MSDAVRHWVLEHHETLPEEIATPEDPNNPSLGFSAQLWWAVANVERPEWEPPHAVMQSREAAEECAKTLNGASHPVWFVTPAVISLWMRNEHLPVELS